MEAATDTGLTKEAVSYLRRADDVYAIVIDGQNYLRAVKRARFDDAFSEDKRVDIPVEGNGANGYFCSAWSFPWRTLRAGQRVRLEWYRDAGTNEALRDVGMCMDELYVHIGNESGRKWARYLVEAMAVPADSLARMCKGSS